MNIPGFITQRATRSVGSWKRTFRLEIIKKKKKFKKKGNSPRTLARLNILKNDFIMKSTL